jgi:replicative DNA helicase
MKFENEDLEKQVLSAMMLSDEERLTAFSALPTLEIFQIAKNRIIAEGIQALQEAGESVSLETVADTLKKSGLMKEAGGVAHLANVFSSLKKPGYVEVHCRILIEHYLRTKAHLIATDLLAKTNSDTGDIFDILNKIQVSTDALLAQTISKSDDNFHEQLEESAAMWMNKASGEIAGYRTGVESLDRLCGGLTNSELTIVGARPGQGKTALVVSLMRNLAKQGIGCGLFSLEMSKHEVVQRLASQESGIFAYKMKQGEMSNYDKSNLMDAVHRMKSWNIKISDEGYLNMNKIRAKATMWRNKFNIKVIFVDYIGLINSNNPKETNRVNVVGEISRGLKLLARELDVPVVALSQLSRKVEERNDKMPIMSDLRESGSVEQDADVIWMMFRPETYDENGTFKMGTVEIPNKGLCIIDQVKMRSGSTGIVPLQFDGPLMRIKEYTQQEDKHSHDGHPF